MIKLKLILIVVIALFIGFFAGIFYEDRYDLYVSSQSKVGNIRLGQHKLINPLLYSEFGADRLRNSQLKPFRDKITQIINEKKLSGQVSDISVYFRDLNDGMAFNINGDHGFEPASLIKIPLMMIFLKHAETNPELLKKKLVYDGKHDWNEDEYFKPQISLVAGQSYTVEELIQRMMDYSDNNLNP